MSKSSIPIGLPDSLLLRELVKKTRALKTAPSRTPAYLEWLKRLRDRIAPELSYTNLTFPLFTPHDEQNHIHPLFVLTERLLGSNVIESLTAAELFVLSCSLYAHDWGMAVSEREKGRLLGLKNSTASDPHLLPDGDAASFARLLKDKRVSEAHSLNEVPLPIWQSHIRNTHAARSAHRVRQFFSTISPHLGDAIALVSESHYWNVERLRTFEIALPWKANRPTFGH